MFIDKTALQYAPIPDSYERIAYELADNGWCVTEDFLDAPLINQLADESRKLFRTGRFRHAGIGHRDSFSIRPEVRTDWIKWLDPSHCTTAQRQYLDALDGLRLTINRILFLGIFEFEGHLSIYPPGCYYRKHLDQFQGTGQRIVTCILYLNHNWRSAVGGQLRLYTDPVDNTRFEEILPIGGRLVTFLSSRFQHSVMSSHSERLSITGWFKTRIPII